MRPAIGHTPALARLATLITAMALILAGAGSFASAMVISAGPVTTLSDYTGGATGVTYAFGTYQVETGETLQTIAFDIPGDAVATGATLLEPAGTMTVTGQTMTIAVSPAPAPGTDVTVRIGGITNPTIADTYPTNASYKMSFTYLNSKGQARTERLSIGSYTITPVPYITMTMPTANIDFGAVDPEIAPPPVGISLVIDANTPYTVTREVTGDTLALGLVVSGDATGAKPPGVTTYAESVSIAPGWDAPAETPLAASIVYTAVPQ